jgi:integrase
MMGIGNFSQTIEAALSHREMLGYSRSPHDSTLRSFEKFCAKSFPEETNLTKELVLGWMEERPSKGAAGAIRFLGKHLDAMGQPAYILPDGFIGGKNTFAPYILTNEELREFFTAADTLAANKKRPFRHIIAPVIFRLLYTCGLRPNEGRELRRDNINFDSGEILITHTKHNKERFVVMSDDMLSLCRQYDEKRRAFFPSSEYFFPQPNGDCHPSKWLTDAFQLCWQGACRAMNSAVPVSGVRVYDLRHRFATARLNLWLDEGKDLYAMLSYLQAYMGHSSLSDTAHYIHILPENLSKSPGVNWTALEAAIPEVNEWPE